MNVSKFCQENNCYLHIICEKTEKTKIKEENKKTKIDVVGINENIVYYLKTITKDGKIGYAKFYRLEDLEKAYRRAIKNAVKFKNVNFNGIKAKPKDNFKKVDYDINEVFENFVFDFNYNKKEISVRHEKTKRQIYDPYGEFVEFKKNKLLMSGMVIANNNDYWYYTSGYDSNNMCKTIKKEINFQYENTKNPGKIEDLSGFDIVFYDFATEEMINFILTAFNGKLFKEQKVWSSSYLNKQLFSESFSIVEDPKGNFLHKYYIDDDCFETTRKNLIENGVIKTMCYDFYSSTIYNEKPTGNGFYVPDLYGLGFTNIDINCEKYDSDRYLVVLEGLGFHTCNDITGDINIVCSLGFVYDKGKIYSIKNVPISFNLLKAAKNIYGFGEKKEMNWIKTPNLLFKL